MNSLSTSNEKPAPVDPVSAAPHGMGRQAKAAVAILVVAALAALFWPRGDGTFKEPGGFLYDASGRATTLGPRLAPVTLVHFWATWCPPCIEEIPALQRLARDFAGHEDFALVMVAVQDTTEKVQSFLGPSADMALYDPKGDVANRYGTQKLPESYIVVGGNVVEKFEGMNDWDSPQVRERLRSLLAATGPRAERTGTSP
jgi:thiol-disulfide isomerase/thioredoxin